MELKKGKSRKGKKKINISVEILYYMKINYDLFIIKTVMTYGNDERYTTFEGHSMNAIYYLFRKIMGNFPVTKRAQCDGSFHLRTVVHKYQ